MILIFYVSFLIHFMCKVFLNVTITEINRFYSLVTDTIINFSVQTTGRQWLRSLLNQLVCLDALEPDATASFLICF